MAPPASVSSNGPRRARPSAGTVTCPRCQSADLMRIRAPAHCKWLRRVGIPAKQYRCNDCLWEGMRIVRSK